MSDFQPVNLNIDKLTKPVDTFIKKISNAIGLLYEPKHIVKIAEANAKANKIKFENDVELNKQKALVLKDYAIELGIPENEVQDLQKRAMYRFISEETFKQNNIESITEKATSKIEDSAKPENMSNDWIVNFFDKCKLVSDNDMQELWAKVLSGEANSPGSYSKRTLDTLSKIDKFEAQYFESICSFRWFIRGIQILIFNVDDDIYKKSNVSFAMLNHLDNIGLITYNNISGYILRDISSQIQSLYFESPIVINSLNNPTNYNIPLGTVLLTKVGNELAKIVKGKPNPDFIDYVLQKWYSENLILHSFHPRIEVPFESEFVIAN